MPAPFDIDRRSGVNYNTKPKKTTAADVPDHSARDAAQARTRYSMTPQGRADLDYEREQRGGLGTTSWNRLINQGGPQPSSNGGGGGGGRSYGGGYGGGGGGNAAAQAAAQSQIDTLMNLLQSGQMRSPQQQFTADTTMRGNLSDAYAADQRRQGAAFDQLDQYVGGLGNAYADGPRAQVAQIDPTQLSALLNSQGGSSDALSAEAQFLQSQNQNSANAQNRYQDAMRDMQAAWNQSVGTEAQQARTFAGEELSAQNRGLEAQIDAQDSARRRQIEDQNFQRQLADRQAMMQLIAQISQISAGAGISTPDMDIDALLGVLAPTAAAPAAAAPAAAAAPPPVAPPARTVNNSARIR